MARVFEGGETSAERRVRHVTGGRAWLSAMGFAVLSLVGCTTEHKDPEVAAFEIIRDARLAVVSDVRFSEGDFVDPPTIDIRLRGDPLEAELVELCSLIERALEHSRASTDLGVTVWDAGLHRIIANEMTC